MATGILEATADSSMLVRSGAVAVLTLHVAGGLVAIVAGYAALAARKGAPPHRIAGNVFFVSMLVLGVFAAVLGMLGGGLFTCYLVATAWLTVRRPPGVVGRLEAAGFVFAAALTLLGLGAVVLKAAGVPLGDGAGPGFLLTAFCAALDLRMIRQGGVAGYERVRRHLWRMCAAMFVATGSFFLGQMDDIPQVLRGPHLWILALAPLAALVFWMIRTRPRRPRLRAAPAAL